MCSWSSVAASPPRTADPQSIPYRRGIAGQPAYDRVVPDREGPDGARTRRGLPDFESLHECSNFLCYVLQVNAG
jgi:hypothetical protein